jgi:hypothetical protein
MIADAKSKEARAKEVEIAGIPIAPLVDEMADVDV